MGVALRPNAPRPGDLVIYRRGASPGTYLLSAFQHATQLTFRSYEDAVRDATAFAAKNLVDAWLTVDGETYERMAGHRRERRAASTAVERGAST